MTNEELYIVYRKYWQSKKVNNPGSIAPKEVTLEQLFENIYKAGYRVGREAGFSEGHSYGVGENI